VFVDVIVTDKLFRIDLIISGIEIDIIDINLFILRIIRAEAVDVVIKSIRYIVAPSLILDKMDDKFSTADSVLLISRFKTENEETIPVNML